MSHVEFKALLMACRYYYFMRKSSTARVDFQEQPCQPVTFKGQWPLSSCLLSCHKQSCTRGAHYLTVYKVPKIVLGI